jgi:hypothetical protein
MPEEKKERCCVAFVGPKRVARGAVTDVALKLRELGACARQGEVLVFDEETSEPIDLDLRGSAAEVVRRIDEAEAAKPCRGRPRLGVEAINRLAHVHRRGGQQDSHRGGQRQHAVRPRAATSRAT